jgi:hypothetical protein
MSLLITQGLGDIGDGSKSGLVSTMGLGHPEVVDAVCFDLIVYAVENNYTNLRIIMNQNLVLAGSALTAGSWSITTDDGQPVSVTAVSYDFHVITLQVTEQTLGATYTIHFPDAGVTSTTGNGLAAGTTAVFTGQYVAAPGVSIVRSVDERTLDIVFTEAVMEADAIITSNYIITPALEVVSATRITDLTYRLVTGPQNLLGDYEVEAQNIRDIAGNPIEPH